jgi:NAD(P)-dependent dehydrogenase (short-subunit alcohol dehydrogenase family)
MVALEAVHASNALITSTLPAGLVAVFVGATSGIGEATLKAFVSVAVRPRVHIIARSSTKGARIVAECQELCPEGHFDLIEADCSLMRDTDAAATRILAKETVLNLLCMSQGDPAFDRARAYPLLCHRAAATLTPAASQPRRKA